MEILYQKNRVIKSVFSNPKKEIFNSIARPITGFACNIVQPQGDIRGITVWLNFTLKINYTPSCYYDFEFRCCYIIDLQFLKPSYDEVLKLIKESIESFKTSLEIDTRIRLKEPIPTSYSSFNYKDAEIVKYISDLILPYTLKWGTQN